MKVTKLIFMIIYRAKVNNIIFEFISPQKSKGIIILCDGLPSVPKQKDLMLYFFDKGFSVVYPRYQGTWESGGEFLKQSPAKDIRAIIKKLQKGVIKELYANKEIKINNKKIFLLASSFGGSVALSLVASKNISKIIVLSPVIDWASHNNKNKEQDLVQLAVFLQKAFPNVYRFDKKNWKRLLKGEVFNPKQKLSSDEAKKILIIYGKEDKVVDSDKIKKYSQINNVKAIDYKAEGHLSFSKLNNKIKAQIIKYFNNKSTI